MILQHMMWPSIIRASEQLDLQSSMQAYHAPTAQVRGLGTRVGGLLALFYIHHVNRVYSALVVTSWTCCGAF